MCFGSKNERSDEPAPRPVQRPPSQDHKADLGSNNPYNPQNSYSNGPGQSSGGPSYAPPQGPPPSQQQNQYQYAPPPGPPPTHQQQGEYAPPSGPPPFNQQQQGDYAPPSGPPPSHQDQAYYAPPSKPEAVGHGQYAPPLGPPPSQSKPKEAWEIAVPDTSLFPPPPAIFSGFERSPTSNATEEEANAGEAWCVQYPMVQPMTLDHPGHVALESGNIRLMEPPGFNGKLNWLSPGHWEGHTKKNTPDRCIIGYPPLYVVTQHDPLRFGKPKTVYYEVKLAHDSPNVFLGLGFTALPYPSFRMPGWHRGSLAIHGDDGHKYINDRWGGKDFTAEFRRGETYGIGMTFRAVGGPKPQVDIFFTRNGTMTGGWALHEETDAIEDLPVTGLEGLHDLSCAIGTYDAVKFEVIFEPSKWLHNPYQV